MRRRLQVMPLPTEGTDCRLLAVRRGDYSGSAQASPFDEPRRNFSAGRAMMVHSRLTVAGATSGSPSESVAATPSASRRDTPTQPPQESNVLVASIESITER